MQRSIELQSKISGAISKSCDIVFGINFYFLLAFIIIYAVIQNGIWFFPGINHSLSMSQDIFTNPFDEEIGRQWQLYSYLGPIIGNSIGMNNSSIIYALMHLIIFLIFFVLLLIIIKKQRGDFIARSVAIAFFLTPLPNILLTWLGSADIFTILFSITIAIFYRNYLILLLLSFMMGFNHFEQGLVILVSMTIFLIVNRNNSKPNNVLPFVITGIGGIVIGRLCLEWYFHCNDFNIQSSRLEYIMDLGIARYAKATFSNIFVLVFSFYNALLIFIIVFACYFYKSRIFFTFVICNAMIFVVTICTLDQTRVFSIMTFHLILLLITSKNIYNLDLMEKAFLKKVITVAFIIGLFVPRFVVWDGKVHASTAYYSMQYLLGNYDIKNDKHTVTRILLPLQ